MRRTPQVTAGGTAKQQEGDNESDDSKQAAHGSVLFSCTALVLDLLLGLRPFSETILEPTRHVLHVSHPARSSGTTALGLESPIELSHLFGWITARRTRLLLNVI